MKHREAWQVNDALTATVSETARKLGFAGGGLAWLLRENGGWSAPAVIGMFLLLAFFLCDVTGYVVLQTRYRRWLKRRERELREAGRSYESGEPYLTPARISGPSYWFWWTKLVMLGLAYGLLIWQAIQSWIVTSAGA